MMIPKRITTNLEALNWWFFDDSNKMVVETCSKTPTTKALIKVVCSCNAGNTAFAKAPKGVILAKINKNSTDIQRDIFDFNKKDDMIIAIGILCTTIPYSSWSLSAIGKPSNKAWIHKLKNNNQGNAAESWWCIWPCSAPLEPNSKKIWVSSPAIINRPTFSVPPP